VFVFFKINAYTFIPFKLFVFWSLVFNKFLQLHRHFTLQMDSDLCDDLISCSWSQILKLLYSCLYCYCTTAVLVLVLLLHSFALTSSSLLLLYQQISVYSEGVVPTTQFGRSEVYL
jgi:hypothetical protein